MNKMKYVLSGGAGLLVVLLSACILYYGHQSFYEAAFKYELRKFAFTFSPEEERLLAEKDPEMLVKAVRHFDAFYQMNPKDEEYRRLVEMYSSELSEGESIKK